MATVRKTTRKTLRKGAKAVRPRGPLADLRARLMGTTALTMALMAVRVQP